MPLTAAPANLSSDDGSLHWYHWFVVTLSLVITLTAWYITKQQVEEKVAHSFARQSQQVVELITERMQKYEDALFAGVALTQVQQGETSHQQWRTYYNNLDIDRKYPGINGLGIIYYVAPDKRDSYLTQQRSTRPNFGIHPQHTRSELWPITYIEPEAKNAAAVGLDMAHESNRYTAAVKARDSGQAQITGPIVLVQDEGKTPGFLFYAPFYRGSSHDSVDTRKQTFIGLVYAPFVVKKLLAGTLEETKRHIGIRISDGGEIIYDENRSDNPNYDVDATQTKTQQINIYGRQWQFDLRSNLLARQFSENKQPLLILVGGLLIDSLLLALFLVLARSNKRAINYASQLTADLEARNQQLSSEAQERERLTLKSEAANHAKSIFLSNMSHELRTPLNAITGLISLCLKTELNNKQKGYLNNIQLASSTLVSLINHTLDYAKIESGKLEVEAIEFNLFEILAKIEAIFSGQFSAKGLDFIVEQPSSLPKAIIGDPLRLEQILLNICGNAYKFTDAGHVRLTLKVTSKTEQQIGLNFVIADTGIGMSSDVQAHLFESFSQADGSTTRQYGGTGLGLAISKQLTELMGGKISVLSQEGQGSQFSLQLELAFNPAAGETRTEERTTAEDKIEKTAASTTTEKTIVATDDNIAPMSAPPKENNQQPVAGQELASASILLVEDMPINQLVAQEMIEDCGASVSIADNGLQALETLATDQHFDIILMDIQMPKMDGYQTTQKIRENALGNLNAQIPIIAMTANAMKGDQEKCLAAGMDDYLMKPIDPDLLITKLNHWLNIGCSQGQTETVADTESSKQSL